MLKALFKLLVLALLPLMFLLFSDKYNPVRMAGEWLQEQYMSSIYLGTMKHIAAQLDVISLEEQELVFNEIANNFGVDLQRIQLSELTTSTSKKGRLKDGELVFLNRDGAVVGYKLKNSDWVITAAAEETEVQDTYRLAKGPIYLLRQALLSVKESELDYEAALLQKEYGFPFKIIGKEVAEDKKSKTKIYQHNDVIWSLNENDNEIFYIDLQNDKTLLIGPVEYGELELLAIVIYVVIFVFCVGLGLFLWLWPLWKDHKRLNESATAFGAGHLGSRVVIKKSSLAANLGKSFNLMADNIQSLISVNQHLTNAVAHDLRTPLARLRFAIEILDSGQCTSEERDRYKKTINTSIDSLDYLINQTLVHSRYNRSTDIKHFKESSFASRIREEVDQYSFDFEQIEFVTNVDNSLNTTKQFVDPKALERALSNLLSNAVKHAKSVVRVSYFKEGEHLCLQVDDDGLGIDEEHCEKILEPFSQLGNKQRSTSEGHGLGLAIVNQIAKWHKGTIVISRSDLGGASIKICWPELIQ